MSDGQSERFRINCALKVVTNVTFIHLYMTYHHWAPVRSVWTGVSSYERSRSFPMVRRKELRAKERKTLKEENKSMKAILSVWWASVTDWTNVTVAALSSLQCTARIDPFILNHFPFLQLKPPGLTTKNTGYKPELGNNWSHVTWIT